MHEVLLAESTYLRTKAQFDTLADVTYVTIDDKGDLKRDGLNIGREDFKISMFLMDPDVFQQGTFPLVLEMIQKAPPLKYIHTAIAGLDSPVFQEMINKTEVFCNSDAQAPAIAEFVVASVLNRWHRFDLRADLQRKRAWETQAFKQVLDSNWLIIGYGNIGQFIAQQVSGFGGEVVGVRRSPQASEYARHVGTLDELGERIPDADVIVLSCSLNETTAGMVDDEFLRQMKSDAVLVNIGRGALVSEPALVAALDAGQVDYAILDVFETEPLPDDSIFWSHEKVQVSAHTSFLGSKTSERYDAMFFNNLQRYVTGLPVRNRV
jgi:phosphoglycerate dehydrogenase-like enzyme